MASGPGRAVSDEKRSHILAYLAALLASECSVPEATTIHLTIIFVLADDPNLAARQLPALGPVLA